MKTYQSKNLKIDLTNGKTEIESRDSKSLEELLGGIGQSFHIIKEQLKGPIKDAYDPRNPLIINIGFLTGSPVMTSRRTYVTSFSPLKTSIKGTPGIYYSTASGGLGPNIRKCGLDSITITGASEEPTYLLIEKTEKGIKVELKDASSLVGKTTNEKIKMLASEYKDAHMAVIGPAGENKVRYANIAFSSADQLRNKSKHMRFAGRGGMGAVMGSKNLQAVVVKGKKGKDPKYSNIKGVKELNKEIATGRKTQKYKQFGTFFANIQGLHALSCSIINNFSKPQDEKSEDLFMEEIEKKCSIKNKGCMGCGIKCWKEISVNNEVLGKLDYENGSLLGPNLGIFDIKEIVETITLTDELGLDAMSTGVILGYIMEYNLRNNKEGLTYGDAQGIKKLIIDIGSGKEKFLAQGVKRISEKLDKEYAMHCKGIEMAAYLGNINPGYAFAIAGIHTSMDTYNKAFFQEAINDVEEWVENITRRGVNTLLYDMHGACKFSKLDFTDITRMLSEMYSIEVDETELKETARRTYALARSIDALQGFAEEDDVMPEECHKDLGLIVKHFNTLDFFRKLRRRVRETLKED